MSTLPIYPYLSRPMAYFLILLQALAAIGVLAMACGAVILVWAIFTTKPLP